ncbi:MAG TPA: flagellar motor switch protein FliG [Clostridiaceae bacterium]|jgi:flagellar motor switch protein FliG|nr:flagellar motor switch protein FliG [Clostridiaceae bacterium]HBG39526.1 flagellar motor switch protein FliG [Clostridiaceae bacterium]HBN27672.1 flagellar motor switch protein FliG [Clostridiaceae bacterium]HBX49034.1 flagellar motor switch protein FliG [Clostridiaceae bacterium]HCL50159.1 flagellar motor switch protein FliG [Clostridiaceae bacterium]
MATRDKEKLTGIQKTAILFITLGPDASAPILKRLPDNDIQRITFEIANMQKIKKDQRDEVLQEFVELNKAKDYIMEGGFEYAKNLLSKALGAQKAKEIIEQVSEITQQYRPFGIARKADSAQLLNIIKNEHPQAIALILCYLQSDKAAQILSGLPEDMQADVAMRIATMSNTSQMVIEEVEGILQKKLSNVVRSDIGTIGGVKPLVDILNNVDRGTEKSILDELDRNEPELAEKIRSNMFIFEDITTLDNTSIQRVLREVDTRDLAYALKGSSEEVANAVYTNMSKRAAQTLKEDIEFLGPVRLIDVEKSQQNIVSIIRRLDETGEIVVARGGEDALII